MINNTLNAMVAGKAKIRKALDDSNGVIPCSYKQSGREINGFIINHKDTYDNDIYTRPNMVIRVKSHTGKEYSKYISDLLAVDGIDEL